MNRYRSVRIMCKDGSFIVGSVIILKIIVARVKVGGCVFFLRIEMQHLHFVFKHHSSCTQTRIQRLRGKQLELLNSMLNVLVMSTVGNLDQTGLFLWP